MSRQAVIYYRKNPDSLSSDEAVRNAIRRYFCGRQTKVTIINRDEKNDISTWNVDVNGENYHVTANAGNPPA